MASFEFPAKTPSWIKVRRLFSRSRFNNSGNCWRSSLFISEIWFPPRFLKKQLLGATVGYTKRWNRKTSIKQSSLYLMFLKSYEKLEFMKYIFAVFQLLIGLFWIITLVLYCNFVSFLKTKMKDYQHSKIRIAIYKHNKEKSKNTRKNLQCLQTFSNFW